MKKNTLLFLLFTLSLLLSPLTSASSIISKFPNIKGFSILVNGEKIEVSDSVYLYSYPLPEYMGEYPELTIQITDPAITSSEPIFSENWPGSATVALFYEGASYLYKLDFPLTPYYPSHFDEAFNTDTSPLQFTSTKIFYPPSNITKSGSIYMTGGKLLMGSTTTESSISLTLSKNLLLKSPFTISFDALSLNTSGSLSVKVHNTERVITGSGSAKDTIFDNHSMTFTSTTLTPTIKITVPGKNPHLIDNIKITQPNPPIDTLIRSNNPFFNHEIINIKNNGIFSPFEKITNIKSINFFADAQSSASFFCNAKLQIEGSVTMNLKMSPMQWYFVGFPFDIDRITIEGEGARSESDIRIRYFDDDLRATTPDTTHFLPLPESVTDSIFPLLERYKGYLMAIHAKKYPAGATVTFKMAESSKSRLNIMQDLQIPLESEEISNTPGPHDGIHLITHPYPCRYIPSPSEIFLTYNGTNYEYDHPDGIKPFEAFFIQSSSTQIKFYKTQRSEMYVSPPLTEKSRDTRLSEESVSRLQFKLSIGEESDKCDLRFHEECSDEFDPGYDLVKLKSPRSDVPVLRTLYGNSEFAISTIAPLKEPHTVTIIAEAGRDGIHKFELIPTGHEELFQEIRLETSSPAIDLKDNHYSINLKKGEKKEFKIRILPCAPNITSNGRKNYQIATKEKTATICAESNCTALFFKIDGRLILQDFLQRNTPKSFFFAEKGIYLLLITDGEKQSRELIQIY